MTWQRRKRALLESEIESPGFGQAVEEGELMRYLGGKARIAKDIARILTEAGRDRKRYVEPFCGSCAVIAEVDHPRRFASDFHPDLILMWKALQKGWVPPATVSEEEYAALRNAEPSALRGFVGFGCSFAGKWFGGYARGRSRNYAQGTRNQLLKRIEKLRGVRFRHAPYWRIKINADDIAYLDPPYAGTTTYKGVPPFDHDLFWEWAEDAGRRGAAVFVSEYAAPRGWRCVWERTKPVMGWRGSPNRATEKLFLYVG